MTPSRQYDNKDDKTWPVPPTELYEAELAPHAVNDLLSMPESESKRALIRLLSGEDPVDVLDNVEDFGIEDLPDPQGGWSALRVAGCVVFYRRLTNRETKQLGRHADILVGRIVNLPAEESLTQEPEYFHIQEILDALSTHGRAMSQAELKDASGLFEDDFDLALAAAVSSGLVSLRSRVNEDAQVELTRTGQMVLKDQ
ncbi:MAG: hypothetical protein M3256_23045 [Actinomycetota bacterium]|nr:hypothetical protein [Actinomycetota bacterium]